MMTELAVILLSIIIAIAIPTKDSKSYKAMYDRHYTIQEDVNKDDKPIRDRKR